MRYSIEPIDRIYVKGYGFFKSFAKNTGKNLSRKYDQKRLDSAKKSTTYAIQLQKGQFKKLQKQLEILLVIKLLIE